MFDRQGCAWFPEWIASGCVFHGNCQIASLWIATSGLKGISKRTVGCGWLLVLFRFSVWDLLKEQAIGVDEAAACAECCGQTRFGGLGKQ